MSTLLGVIMVKILKRDLYRYSSCIAAVINIFFVSFRLTIKKKNHGSYYSYQCYIVCDALLFVYDFSVFLCSLSTVDFFFFLKGGGGGGKRKNHFRSLGCPLLLKPL